MDRIAPTRRPDEPVISYHEWRTLLFAHWEVPVAALRPLVPKRLEIDTFEGRAFVGLVPFTMRGVRPRFVPPMPGLSDFHETNVRTYVHLDGKDPGVWFFSLDAANLAAVAAARAGFALKYHFARMSLVERGDRIDYTSERRYPPPTPASLDVTWTIGRDLGNAAPGTLEHFLAERYVLYSARGEKLWRGRVHHHPYPLREAKIDRLRESLIAAAGIDTHGEPVSVLYSPGVDVEIFPLRRV